MCGRWEIETMAPPARWQYQPFGMIEALQARDGAGQAGVGRKHGDPLPRPTLLPG